MTRYADRDVQRQLAAGVADGLVLPFDCPPVSQLELDDRRVIPFHFLAEADAQLASARIHALHELDFGYTASGIDGPIFDGAQCRF
jgi:hypothetical protein